MNVRQHITPEVDDINYQARTTILQAPHLGQSRTPTLWVVVQSGKCPLSNMLVTNQNPHDCRHRKLIPASWLSRLLSSHWVMVEVVDRPRATASFEYVVWALTANFLILSLYSTQKRSDIRSLVPITPQEVDLPLPVTSHTVKVVSAILRTAARMTKRMETQVNNQAQAFLKQRERQKEKAREKRKGNRSGSRTKSCGHTEKWVREHPRCGRFS